MRKKRTYKHTLLALLLLQGALCWHVVALDRPSEAPAGGAPAAHTSGVGVQSQQQRPAGVSTPQQQAAAAAHPAPPAVTAPVAAAATAAVHLTAAVQQKLINPPGNAASPPPPQAPTITSESAQQQLVVDGLSIDIVAAEAAARPAAQLPSEYAIKGIIDPQSPLFSEDPGVLVPLAQGHSPVGDWLAAVEAAGPGTPLSDPMFVGTVFVPHNEAFEEVYPELRLSKLQGLSASDVLVQQGSSNASTASLALQLNCLTVPGQALTMEELWPGRLLRTAGFGAVKVIDVRGDDKPVSARLQHQPSGVYFSIVEPDLQSGNAVAHVIDVLPPASVLSRVAVAPEATSHTWQYRSVMMAMSDPVRSLQTFTLLVQRAALTGLLDSSSDAFTLFAPNEKAMEALLASLPVLMRQRLLMNDSLADAFVSSHLVLGTALGSKALEALLPAGQLKTAQGNLAVGSGTEHPPMDEPPSSSKSGAVALIEAGRQLPDATPGAHNDSTAAAAAAAAASTQPGQPAAATAAAVAAQPPLAAATPGAEPLLSTTTSTAAQAAAAGDPQPDSQAAAAAAPPEAAVAHQQRRLLSVAEAGIIASDLIGGKAVLHVVDRVLISPALGQQLGLPPNSGYTELDAPSSHAGSSSSGGRARRGSGWVLYGATAAAAAVLLALL